MESRVARESERALIEATQKLSPEERIEAYLRHSRLVAQLQAAVRQQPLSRQQADQVDRK